MGAILSYLFPESGHDITEQVLSHKVDEMPEEVSDAKEETTPVVAEKETIAVKDTVLCTYIIIFFYFHLLGHRERL